MQAPNSQVCSGQGWIECCFWRGRGRRRRKPLLSSIKGRLQLVLDFVKPHASGPFVGSVDLAQSALSRFELAAFGTQKRHSGFFECRFIGGRVEGNDRLGDKRVELTEEFRKCHDRAPKSKQAALTSGGCFLTQRKTPAPVLSS
jgi:hypothetical protein